MASRFMFSLLLSSVIFSLRTRHELQIDCRLAPPDQRPSAFCPPQARLRTWDRIFWVWLFRIWPAWRSALVIVKPETVIAWHRKCFRLFPAVEREPVQRVLDQSVIFLTADNIHRLITSSRWLSTAWKIANIYLDSIGAEPLGKGHPFQAVGLGEETASYISLKYFREDDPFADYVVHEIAHLFHNWKRAPIPAG